MFWYRQAHKHTHTYRYKLKCVYAVYFAFVDVYLPHPFINLWLFALTVHSILYTSAIWWCTLLLSSLCKCPFSHFIEENCFANFLQEVFFFFKFLLKILQIFFKWSNLFICFSRLNSLRLFQMAFFNRL